MRRIFLILVALIFSGTASAQLITDNTYTPQDLVDIIVGDGIVVSNVTMNCPQIANAYFDGNATNIGIATGILLTSGEAAMANGPNNAAGAGACNGSQGDPSVSSLSNNAPSFDACILEFDMIPTCTQITFSYVFGSEEYPEYINREFVDGMVILISGPGIAGIQNIALVPNTILPVNIRNINQNNNNAYYNGNNGGTSIQYDGFTDVLSATATVIPCEKYHIKIAIADIIDCIFDSGLFIAENSLDCGVSADAVVTNAIQNGINPIEGCKTISVDFCRQGSTVAPFNLNLTFAGTAVNGVDYVQIPSTLSMQPGEQCATVVINPISDGINEGTETLLLVFETISGDCSLLDTVRIDIWDDQGLVADFIHNDVCLGSTMFFNNATTIIPPATVTNFLWDFDDNGAQSTAYNPSYLYANQGTYNVMLVATSNSGCVDTVFHQVNVYDYPTASFTFSNSCQNIGAVFTNTSTPASNDVIGSVLWNFGDGVSSTSWDVTHHYSLPNSYPVVLQVFNSIIGCSSTFRDTIDIYPSVNTDFLAANVCYPNPVNFINQSVGVAQWEWDFGDGSAFDSNFNTSHIYATADTFDVRLVGITPDGCNDTTIKRIYVFDSPVASFTTNDVCANVSALFTNTSQNPTMGTLNAWYWLFSDNTTSSAFSPIKNFPAGNYDATLIVYSSNLGCTDTAYGNINIFPVPVADFTVSNVCDLIPVVPDNLSQGLINTYEWDFGDNTAIDYAQNPTHLYSTASSYTIELKVISPDFCVDSVSKPVTIYQLPVAQFTVSPVCDGFPANFQNTSSIPFPDNIVTWQWNFGDGDPPVTAVNATHVYPNYGSYDAQLLVVSGHGCRDSVTQTVIIHPNPVPDFTMNVTEGCPPLCVRFTDLSTIATGSIDKWNWNLGDLTLSSLQHPQNCYYNEDYYNPQFYSISLEVISDNGCKTDSIFANAIQVYPVPLALFSHEPAPTTFLTPQIFFTDQSINAISWNWDFGEENLDSDTSSLQHPDYTYTIHGKFPARLIVENSYGCLDTVEHLVIIEADFVLYFPNAFTPNEDGSNDIFIPQGIGVKEIEWWVYDRWGERIFITNDTITGWDGTVRASGKLAPQGVYVYHARAKSLSNEDYTFTGKVVLLRKPKP